MKASHISRTLIQLLIAVVLFSLLSPKWLFWPAAFLAPAFLISGIRSMKLLRAYFVTVGTLTLSHVIANYLVMPFPIPLAILIAIQQSIFNTIPYIAAKWLSEKIDNWTSTLIFPCLAVVIEYVTSFFGGGTWGSIAYSQMDNLQLIQFASITGIWGISFLIYWAAAIMEWAYYKQSIPKVPAISFTVILTTVLAYGAVKTNPYWTESAETVRVAGVTGNNVFLLGEFYKDAFGKELDFDPMTLSINSPELTELNKGLLKFIENPDDSIFTNSHQALRKFQDSMFSVASLEAKSGAAVIAFSEALMFTFKPIEDDVIKRGQEFALSHHVTLLLTLGSFIPGKPEFGSKYIENKAILIKDDGSIANVFFKNKPVPIVEGSVPGDGSIPVYDYGRTRLATSICYDADFPALMRQAGLQNTDILLLPAGDWKEVSPYHGNMARMRAIENGFAMMRPASGATSIACDSNGKIFAMLDFFDSGVKSFSVNFPTNGKATLYAFMGDYFPILCALLVVGIAVLPLTRRARKLSMAKT